MVTKVQKWGNSLGLRIPRAYAQEAGIEEGSPVDVFIEGDRIIIQSLRAHHCTLKDLLSLVRKDNIHEEIPAGDPQGCEVW